MGEISRVCRFRILSLVSTLLRSGTLDFDGFLMLMGNKNRETDIEIHYKDTFRAFSKDDDGVNLILLTKFTIYPFFIFEQDVFLRRN